MRAFAPFVVLALFSAGCAVTPKWTELSRSTTERHFTLATDHLRTRTRGLLAYKWLEGLRAGTYTLRAEDERGFYYVGDRPCVVVLSGRSADEYLATGTTNVTELPGMAHGIRYGGLWLPKDGVAGVGIEPKLFVILGGTNVDRQQLDNAVNASVRPANAAAGVGAALGGSIVAALAADEIGRVYWVPYGSEKEFISSLQFVDGPPPVR